MLRRVASTTQTSLLAGSIAHHVRESKEPLALQAIGAAAVNQLCKGLATAREYLEPEGIAIAVSPRWVTVDGQRDGEEVSALRFEVTVTAASDDLHEQ